ncbi:MAG: type 4a pilus biogenesis protein PilO [Candidatus Omnitrophica bacterium]|nr:type 4a pilus biogenesis protein PilO [Candidatus Omnitrophota bacterium]
MKLNIQELIAKVDEKNRYYILIGALVLIFLLDYFVVMQPQLVALTKIRPEIKILLQNIQTARDDTQKTGFYQGEIKRLQGVLGKTSRKVLSKDEVSAILERISRLAGETGMKMDQIPPFNEDQEILLEDRKRTYYALPILLEARSGYHNFGKFLNRLEQDDLFLSVTTFSVSAGDDIHDQVLKMNLQAIIFEDKAS